MANVFGAIAEGTFSDVGFLTSLGKAGVDRHGNLKENACTSPTSAKLRALKSVANKLRFQRHPNGPWTPFKELSSDVRIRILEEVNSHARWEELEGNVSHVSLLYADFQGAYMRSGVA